MSAKLLVKHSPQSLTLLVMTLIKPYKKWLVLIFLAMLLETAMSLLAPWPLKIVIDNVVGHHALPHWLFWLRDASMGKNKMEIAALAAFGIMLIALIGGIAGYFDNYFTESVAQNVANDLRIKLYHHLQRLSLSFYDSHQVGNILSTITSDVSTIQEFASSALLNILIDILTILGMLGLMFYLNWDFALVAVSVTPLLLLFVTRFKKAVKKATHDVRNQQSNMVSVLQQGLESVRSVKAFGRQDLEEAHLKNISLDTVRASLKARKVKSLLSPVVGLLVSACTAFVIWRGSYLILTEAMTIGGLTVFLSYLSKFFKPVQDLAKTTTSIAQASVSLERIQSILEIDSAILQRPDAMIPPPLKGNIRFDHVAFSYDPESPVLKDVHFSIGAGQRIGICGPTGGGKSTVVSLIPRFYDPTKGIVLIDGINIQDYEMHKLRDQIAFVLQDTVLFYGTIRENIAYGKINATNEEIERAAVMSNAEEFISKMTHGYDTLVGERGLTLSGGQRQRIGIARAIVRDSPILILDEPTAALDTESEKLVMDALEKLMEGRTVIVIAHRLSTIRDADKIIVLKGGYVTEEGTHEQLIEMGKIYAELYQIQAGTKPPVTLPSA